MVLQIQKGFSPQDIRFFLVFAFRITETNLPMALYFLHVKKLAFADVAIILCRLDVIFTCRKPIMQL
jgi:hypothetical protein